jgi:Protein of unknown function (DUF3891)
MILTRVPEGLLVVRQTDHGSQTGLFAATWGNEEVPPPSGPDDTTLAARHHDDGWAVWERRPSIDLATGRPVQFLALTPVEHVPLYRAGIERAAQHSPWVGLLVSMHGAGLYNDRYGTFRLNERQFDTEEQALVDEFLSDMAALQDRLAIAAGIGTFGPERHASDDPDVRARYLLLQVWDRLSLQYVFRLAGDGIIAPLPIPGPAPGATAALTCRQDGPFGLTLDPYPFAEDRTTFPVAACVVPDRRYRSPEDFLAAVADAPARTIECRARAGTRSA